MDNVKKHKSFWPLWGPAIIMMLLIFIFSSFPSAIVPDFGQFDFSVKKGAHMIGYALLANAYNRGIDREKPISFILAFLMVIIYATSDEFHQSFVPGRGARITDVGIDSIGAFVGLIPPIFRWLNRKRLLTEL
jgi:VanZ family protein